MIQPKYLKSRDTVAIVSTARKILIEEIKPAIDLLESWNLKVVVGKTIGASYNQFAGSDDLRVQDFQEMINNKTVKAIWCARGGYGTVKIIDKINFDKFIKNPKWIIGYSDVTVLHSHLHNLGIKTLHSTMPINVPKNTKIGLISLKNALFGENTAQNAQFSTLNRIGYSEGIIVGGNLSILYSLLGSSSGIDTKGKILFIEDLDEYVYHIDRMMMALKRNKMLENLNGLIVGGMTQMHDNSIPFGKTAEEIILEAVAEYNFPVSFNFPAGHIDDNRTLILGSMVKIEVNSTETILKILD